MPSHKRDPLVVVPVSSLIAKPPLEAADPFNDIILSPIFNVVESTVVVVPLTVKSPLSVRLTNSTLSSVLSPKSTAVAATPFVVSATAPCAAEAMDEPETIPAANPATAVADSDSDILEI